MSNANIEIVRRIYEAWNGKDPVGDVPQYLDPDFEWVNPAYAYEPGIRRGHEGWEKVCASLSAAFEWFEHVPGELLASGDNVLCLTTFRAHGRDSSVPFETAEPQVWTLREGKAIRLQWFHDEDEAREAAGLPHPPSRPLVLVVDESAAHGRAVRGDLERALEEGEFEFRHLDSADAAVALLQEMRDRGGEVALLAADQDLGGRTGIELITEARKLYEHLKTIVLIRYADSTAALDAMHAGSLDYYFVKPLDPTGGQIAPIATDLLADWRRWRDHATASVRLVGAPGSAAVQPLRQFLARNDIQYRFVDPESREGGELLHERGPDALPVVALADGKRLTRPSALALAQALGMRTSAGGRSYDLIVVGAGPAGLAGALYGASEGLRTLLIERLAPGGQAGQSSKIENYLGFPGGLTGADLAQRAIRQCRRFDAEVVRLQEAVGLAANGSTRIVRLSDGTELSARAALVSCGVSYRRLEAPGLGELIGRGVHYGAGVSDAKDFAGQDVVIVGGANSAGQAAMHFSNHARRVTMLVRGDSLASSMSHYLLERISSTPNIEVALETRVVGVSGEDGLECVAVSRAGGERRELGAKGMFIFIGASPHTEWLAGTLGRDERGFVLTGRDGMTAARTPRWPLERDPYLLESCMPGVFVAGDVRHGSIKRVASAVGEGAMAVQFVHQHLAERA
jgi:thioredoxin reductase (NADPH)